MVLPSKKQHSNFSSSKTDSMVVYTHLSIYASINLFLGGEVGELRIKIQLFLPFRNEAKLNIVLGYVFQLQLKET